MSQPPSNWMMGATNGSAWRAGPPATAVWVEVLLRVDHRVTMRAKTVFLVGASGTGKTYSAAAIAEPGDRAATAAGSESAGLKLLPKVPIE